MADAGAPPAGGARGGFGSRGGDRGGRGRGRGRGAHNHKRHEILVGSGLIIGHRPTRW